MGEHEEDYRSEITRPQLSHEPILDLVRRVQAGDAAAAHALYDLFAPLIRGTLAHYWSDSDLYADLHSFAYLLFHRLILAFDPAIGVNLFTYLERTIARPIWTYVRQARALQVRRLDEDSPLATGGEEADETSDSPEEAFAHSEKVKVLLATPPDAVERAVILRAALRAALSKLTRREREVFDRWWQGLEAHEIASDLSISRDAAYKALERALKRLRAELKKNLEEDV